MEAVRLLTKASIWSPEYSESISILPVSCLVALSRLIRIILPHGPW
jgi:hypothetical protein